MRISLNFFITTCYFMDSFMLHSLLDNNDYRVPRCVAKINIPNIMKENSPKKREILKASKS